MSRVPPLPPARDLPPRRLGQRRDHLLTEIARERDSHRAPAPLRLRWSGRRRIFVVAAAAVVVVVGAASAFAIVRDVFFVKPFAHGRVTRTVEGVRFSLNVPRTGWENGPHERVGRTKSGPFFRTHSLLISKSLIRGQSAEAVIFWAGFRDRTEATPCERLFGASIGQSAAAMAAAVARAPGTKLVSGPTRVTVGGRPAQHVVLRVRRNLGCNPGYFFTWPAPCWGACWGGIDATGTVRVWIVDVNGTRLFFEAATKERFPPPYATDPVPAADLRKVEQEIAKIIASIRFG